MQRQRPVVWSELATFDFIQLRVFHDSTFNGKRGSASDGWKKVAIDMARNHGMEYTPKVCKKKWDNMMKKYKEIKTSMTGVGTEDGQTPNTWPFLSQLDEFLGDRYNIAFPFLIESGRARSSSPRPSIASSSDSQDDEIRGGIQQARRVFWTDEASFYLIEKRKSLNDLFTGKRGSASDGWKKVAKFMKEKFGNDFRDKVCRKKWEQLLSKYKGVRAMRSVKREEGAEEFQWRFFDVIDEFSPHLHNLTMFMESSPKNESRDRSRSPLRSPLSPSGSIGDVADATVEQIALRVAHAEERKALALETMAAAIVQACEAVTHFLKS